MIVTVKLAISPHPPEDVETALVYAAGKLTSEKKSIQVEFPEEDPEQVIFRFWIPDKSYYKVVDDISEAVKMACWQFYRDITILFDNDRKRKPRSGRRRR